MLRKILAVALSVLVGSVALAGPAPAAGYDLTTALTELATAAAVTRTEALKGFSSTGTIASYRDDLVDVVVDAAGQSSSHTLGDENAIEYSSRGVGQWIYLSGRTWEAYTAGLAYIGKPNARHVIHPGADVRPESGGDRAERPDEGNFTLLSADKVDDGNGHLTYTFAAYVGDSARPSTITAELTDGLVTRFATITPITPMEGDRTRIYDRSWKYGPQELVIVPPPSRTATAQELHLSRPAVVLAETVKIRARQTARMAKSLARQAHHKKVKVRDIRTAAAQITAKYDDTGHWRDVIPVRAAPLTGGVALYATDPYKHKVRIATIQIINGKVVVSM